MPKYRTVTEVVYRVEEVIEADSIRDATAQAREHAEAVYHLESPTYYLEVGRAPD